MHVKMSSNWLHDEFPTLSAGKFRLTVILQAQLLKTNDNVVGYSDKLHFQTYSMKKCNHFFAKKMGENSFSAKNFSLGALGFDCTRFNKSMTNNFINPIALRKAFLSAINLR